MSTPHEDRRTTRLVGWIRRMTAPPADPGSMPRVDGWPRREPR